jgi:hypothetical protein
MGLMRKFRDKSRKASSQSDDRRATCRYAVVEKRAWLGWWNDRGFEKLSVQIIDISTAGCRMRAPKRLEHDEDQPAWLYPLGTALGQWIEGTIVSIDHRSFGPCSIGMKFASDLDYGSFKKLVHGADDGPKTNESGRH